MNLCIHKSDLSQAHTQITLKTSNCCKPINIGIYLIWQTSLYGSIDCYFKLADTGDVLYDLYKGDMY